MDTISSGIIESTRTVRSLLLSLPRKHALIVLTLAVFLLILSFAVPNSKEMAVERHVLPIEFDADRPLAQSQIPSAVLPIPVRPRPEPAPAEPVETTPTAPVEVSWKTVEVRQGDSLSRLFGRIGLNDRTLHQVLRKNEQAKALSHIYPGESLGFQIEQGELQAIRYVKSPLETLLIKRDGDTFKTSRAARQPEIQHEFRQATIKNSLFNAGNSVDLPHSIIMGLANIFSGVIDFVYDPREGDSFSVLYEELYLDGKKYDEGKILAARFTNNGTEYPAYYYSNGKGQAGFYNERGISMRKAFLRSPVDFTRISSNFNPARLHPIFKTRRPHRGIDYVASRGTPIFATGDGRVTQAGYSRANGNFLVISHGEKFITKYLHLHKKQVKQGQRVKQGQIIGQVGSTGYATGAHLHYEFLLNGVHRNPRTIHKKLPKAQSISSAEMPRFKAALEPLQAGLGRAQGANMLASRDADAELRN